MAEAALKLRYPFAFFAGGISVLLDYMTHKLVFEKVWGKEIQEGQFRVEQFYPYYFWKFISMVAGNLGGQAVAQRVSWIRASRLLTYMAEGFLGSAYFGAYYALIRPLAPPRIIATIGASHTLDGLLGAAIATGVLHA